MRSDGNVLKKGLSIAGSLLFNTGGSVSAELGIFFGSSLKQSRVDNLFGESIEFGVALNNKLLTNFLPSGLKSAANKFPSLQGAAQIIDSEGILGVQLGVGGNVFPNKLNPDKLNPLNSLAISRRISNLPKNVQGILKSSITLEKTFTSKPAFFTEKVF